ncbi:MAG TPA: glycosyl hydrolase, partial [Bacillota bacterium]|nr:glycosyl hydrolase [Bacillota bacterium]
KDVPDLAGEEDVRSLQVRDLTAQVTKAGMLHWQVPAGRWEILRLGYTLNDHARVSTSSDGWKGFALDPIDGRAFNSYWQQVVEPLLSDAGPQAGRTLKYLHTDSWEVEVLNWTPTLREEFKRRRGYDLLPFLPVMAGHLVDSRSLSGRFLHDFRKTIGDLAIDNHFRPFRDNAHRYGMAMHPESGGPHCVPIDSLRCLGMDDAPMSEFWARSWKHRVSDADRFFVKQPASAAHTYGRRLVLAEGFTDIGLHWQETLWDNLKPSFDRAACEGLNLLVWHAFVCSPAEMGLPGQQYFAGTHFNPNTTWWPVSGPFLAYLNRSQFLLQRGLFVADVCYYYGDHVPNFTQLKRSDPAKVLPGYDYDVVTEEVLLSRMATREGRLMLPDGMSYRLLVLPNYTRLSLPVLRKLKELVAGGATVLGPKPVEPTSLENYPHCDQEFTRLADELWGKGGGQAKAERACGKGRVIWGRTARQVLQADGMTPDFEVLGGQPGALDYIHRREGDAEIYFVASSLSRWENFSCAFRASGKVPELWLPDTGEIRRAPVFQQASGRTFVPLRLEPYGSAFIVFRAPAAAPILTASLNGQPVFATGRAADFTNAVEVYERDNRVVLQTGMPGEYCLKDARNRQAQVTIPALPAPRLLAGGWTLQAPLHPLDAAATKPLTLDTLKSWTEFADPNLKYFSGTLQYSRELELSQFGPGERLWLDLGEVHELAEVELNGHKLGILWKPPTRIEITSAAKPGKNHLVVRVTNFWPNRIIGDQLLPPAQRVTRTNIRKLTNDTPLMPSGLLGPVRLVSTAERLVQF